MSEQRYKLVVAYRGTRYHGWQKQLPNSLYKGPTPPPGHGIPTVQETLARTIAGVVGHPVNLVGSSRTDTGVHAKGQVAHFDTNQLQIPPEGMRRTINHRLPEDILVRSIEPVASNFDAISSARRKRYQYFIWNTPDRPMFFSDLVWHRWKTLDIDAMQRAAKHFVGTHDFASFARARHGRESTVRTVLSCSVTARSPKLVIGVEGTGFLWNMVRIIVGTLVEVGIGQYTPNDIPDMLSATNRRAGGSTAPPQGLYLQWVQCGPSTEESPLNNAGWAEARQPITNDE